VVVSHGLGIVLVAVQQVADGSHNTVLIETSSFSM